jgi:hypothetical protein
VQDKIAGFTIKFQKDVNKRRKLPDFGKVTIGELDLINIPQEEVDHIIASTTMGEDYRGITKGNFKSMIPYGDFGEYRLIQFSFLRREHNPYDINRKTSISSLLYDMSRGDGMGDFLLIVHPKEDKVVGFCTLEDGKDVGEIVVLTSYLDCRIEDFSKKVRSNIRKN